MISVRSLSPAIGFSLAVLAACGVIAGAWWLYFQPRYSIEVTPHEVAVSRREAPSEAVPTVAEKQTYVVAADAPRYLRIERLGIEARVLQVGLDDEGKIAAPAGVWDVGWYSGSSRPGEAGVSFIDGHISGPTLPAIFKELHLLQPNDIVTVERGDGTQLRYEVASIRTQQLEEVDMENLLSAQSDGKSTLVLMTCGGKFDHQAVTYDQRVVVISTLL